MRVLLIAQALVAAVSARFVMYADEWHPTRPTNAADRAGIDHVVLAFAMANATASFQPKVPVSTIRSEFPNAKVMIAVGGWGDDMGFFQASKTDASIKQFAADVATMLTNTGADGVDIDWEYPGGNGGDYRQVPNSEKTYQIDALPKFLAATRAAIGKKLLSIAVPGKKGDMIAFTKENGPKIWSSVDYINVMSYDLMNRRDNITNHHSSVADSIQTIENYLAIDAPPQKINLGFAYYAKYFTTQGDCSAHPLGCPIIPAEDPVTGKDALTSGAWTFETYHMKPVDGSSLPVSYDGTCGPEKGTRCSTGCCSQYGNCGTSPEHCSGACQHAFGTGCTDPDVAGSWQTAMTHGVTDKHAGGQYYFDAANRLFWTWDTPELISQKFDQIVRKYRLGGVMAWSLGEDSYDWSHIKTMAKELGKGGYGGGGATQQSSHPLIPAPAPAPAPAAVQPQASTPTPSKEPHDIVLVDGVPQGPEGDHVTQPVGSSDDFVVPAEESFTPQQKQPLAPIPKAVPVPVQQATSPQPSAADDDLPFSPEYLAMMKGIGRRQTRRERILQRRYALEGLKELNDVEDLKALGDLDDLGEVLPDGEGTSVDQEVPTEQEVPTGQAPTGQAPTGQAPTGQAPTGQAPTGQVLTEQMLPTEHTVPPAKVKPLTDVQYLGSAVPVGWTNSFGQVIYTGWLWTLKKRIVTLLA